MLSRPWSPHPIPNRRVLIVGNYCHDVLIQNGSIVAETLGGASFVSNVEARWKSKGARAPPIILILQNFKLDNKVHIAYLVKVHPHLPKILSSMPLSITIFINYFNLYYCMHPWKKKSGFAPTSIIDLTRQ